MLTICVLAATGSAVAVLGFLGMFLAMLASDGSRSRVPALVFSASVLIAAIGMGSCAAEDRICEVAGLQP
jgi:hypothetical protein